MLKEIEQKQKDYEFYMSELQRLREIGADKYDNEVVYARNRVKWLYREIQSLKYKMGKKND